MPVLAEHGMTPLYGLSSTPTALPPLSVHVHPALLETEAAPCLAPDATAPAFGSGSTSAAPTHALDRDPHSLLLPWTLVVSSEPSRATYLAAFRTTEAPSTTITTTTGSVMVTSSMTAADASSFTPVPAIRLHLGTARDSAGQHSRLLEDSCTCGSVPVGDGVCP
ncbi:hypothetical protein E2562_039494 [Oryza meyeriana var. granulata]|uniref:Uncharacterized protein n=1 Tax=Oryza meyeriana var. granulata TaxID=110450 RepID=A0A6G1DU10_9ORYZ|nr:hypothetical protein E2562_039494 [Oryza meyeriana var. granulata]